MIASCVSRPEFSASVLGTTRRALAKASTPSWARCSKFTDTRICSYNIDNSYTNTHILLIWTRGLKYFYTPWTVFFTSLIRCCLAATSKAPAPWNTKKYKRLLAGNMFKLKTMLYTLILQRKDFPSETADRSIMV